ncbi:GntR family transcriptional regulator [Fictibacillus norfolkensis]|uniref:GntR family transcriptional regulator n=1 Tax=Fictibacillus norfolkensis TaxID=2762233 RepID=A0ABR8SN74_9BACL|nr:GntR family transcriptional regulator [Fictibacillus norfolkensis]MBD7964902.1 GntR family transcriptional regulator [Fictibacillus norfolkensis]
MENKPFFDNLNLHERVYMYVRDKIINNELKPGSRIDYEELISELGVSRTPLRDAINRLQHDKLIEVKPRSGTFVSVPRPKDIEEIYDVRKPLECLAVKLSAQHLSKETYKSLLDETDEVEAELNRGNVETFFQSDRNLHKLLIVNADNSRLLTIMNSLEVQIKWFGVIMTINVDRPLQANEMHRKLIKAMHDGRVEEAIQIMGAHIDEVKHDILQDFLQHTKMED